MTYKSCITLLVSSVVAFIFPALAIAQTNTPVKQRIAVYPFEDSTTNIDDMKVDMKISKKLTDMLVGKLANDGAFTVLDRQKIDEIIKEKNLKYDMNFDSAGAPKTGLMGVVDIIVFGQISAFNAKSTPSSHNAIIYKETKKTADVTLVATARFVSVEKGSVVAAPTAHASQTNKDFCTARTFTKPGSQPITTGSCSDDTPILRELADKSIEQAATQLTNEAAQVAKTLPPPSMQPATNLAVDGHDTKGTQGHPSEPSTNSPGVTKCLGFEDGLATIAAGSADGIKPGSKFKIRRGFESKILDSSGKPIIKHRDICTLTVSSVEDHSAEGKCMPLPGVASADATPERNDEAVPVNDKSPQVASNGKHSSH